MHSGVPKQSDSCIMACMVEDYVQKCMAKDNETTHSL